MSNTDLTEANTFIEDLLSRRSKAAGGTPHRAIEFYNGVILEPTAFEPDPNSYRYTHYYNAARNRLYIKKMASNGKAFWKEASY